MQQTTISDGRGRTKINIPHDRRNKEKNRTAAKKKNGSPRTAGSPYLLKKIRPKKNEYTRAISRADFLTVRKDLMNYIRKKNLNAKNIPNRLCPEFFDAVCNAFSEDIFECRDPSIVRIGNKPHLGIMRPLTFFENDLSCEIDIDGIQFISDDDLRKAIHSAICALLKHTPVSRIDDTVWNALAEEFEFQSSSGDLDEQAENYNELSQYVTDLLQSSKRLNDYAKENIINAYLQKPQMESLLDKCLEKELPRNEYKLAEFLKENIDAFYTDVFEIDELESYCSVTINGYDHFPLTMGCKYSPINTGMDISNLLYEGDVEEYPFYGEFTLKEDGLLYENENELIFLSVIQKLNGKLKTILENGNNITDKQ